MATIPKKPWIETPLIWSKNLSEAAGCNIYLKLENNQPSGSFKSRGVGNYMLAHLPKNQPSATANGTTPHTTHFFCSSGGNAGLACVHAATTLGYPATIVVPLSTTAAMVQKLRKAGAQDVVQIGASWFEADQHLREVLLPQAQAKGEQAVYVPPFDHPEVWNGNATLVNEVASQLPEAKKHYAVKAADSGPEGSRVDAIICSVGGGGLFSGIMQGVQANGLNQTQIIAVETVGADSLSQAVQAKKLVTLPGITSIATSLGARTVAQKAFEYASNPENKVVTSVLTDADAVAACIKFADEERTLVEPACGVSLALCYQDRLKGLMPGLKPSSNVVVVVCGGSNVSLQSLDDYAKKYL